MKAPGVETRPILLINATSPFCETFFTDVKAPKDQLFGPLNGGWTVAKRLLQFERDNISAGGAGGQISPATPPPPGGGGGEGGGGGGADRGGGGGGVRPRGSHQPLGVAGMLPDG